jgi:hypothetical protein
VLNDGVLFEKERPLDRLEDHLSTGSRTGVRGKKKRKATLGVAFNFFGAKITSL